MAAFDPAATARARSEAERAIGEARNQALATREAVHEEVRLRNEAVEAGEALLDERGDTHAEDEDDGDEQDNDHPPSVGRAPSVAGPRLGSAARRRVEGVGDLGDQFARKDERQGGGCGADPTPVPWCARSAGREAG